jgi:hypothetical protein
MFPNILMFHPEAARAILEYRIRTLGGALENARNLGYQVRGSGHCPIGPPPQGQHKVRTRQKPLGPQLGYTVEHPPPLFSVLPQGIPPKAGVWDVISCPYPNPHSPPPLPQGAKFAWESAGSGLEVCPEDIYGAQEIHINGAVVLAFQLYYYTTQVRSLQPPGVAIPTPCNLYGTSPGKQSEEDCGSQAFLSGHSKGRHWAYTATLWCSGPCPSFPRTCISSKRLVAGTWSVLWLSFGAAV